MFLFGYQSQDLGVRLFRLGDRAEVAPARSLFFALKWGVL